MLNGNKKKKKKKKEKKKKIDNIKQILKSQKLQWIMIFEENIK